MFLETEFGVCVQVLPSRGHFAVKQIDDMWNLHGERLHRMLKLEASTLAETSRSLRHSRLPQALDNSSL